MTVTDRTTSNLRQTVIVDVDGTVADMGKGLDGRRSPYDWHRVDEDTPIRPVIELVGVLRKAGYAIVFMSGRKETCRDKTTTWLRAHGVADEGEPLFMRADNDNRPDHIVKAEMFDRDFPHATHQVAFVVDDRRDVVKMWRGRGLTVLQVADGDF